MPKVHSFLKHCLHDLNFMKTRYVSKPMGENSTTMITVEFPLCKVPLMHSAGTCFSLLCWHAKVLDYVEDLKLRLGIQIKQNLDY